MFECLNFIGVKKHILKIKNLIKMFFSPKESVPCCFKLRQNYEKKTKVFGIKYGKKYLSCNLN